MSYRTVLCLAAAAVLTASISTDALARGGARAHARVHHGAVVHHPVRRGVAVGVGAAAVGAAAYGSCRAWQCGPYGACGWVYTC
jgi:hypothetical protein